MTPFTKKTYPTTPSPQWKEGEDRIAVVTANPVILAAVRRLKDMGDDPIVVISRSASAPLSEQRAEVIRGKGIVHIRFALP